MKLQSFARQWCIGCIDFDPDRDRSKIGSAEWIGGSHLCAADGAIDPNHFALDRASQRRRSHFDPLTGRDASDVCFVDFSDACHFGQVGDLDEWHGCGTFPSGGCDLNYGPVQG